ncbi:MAG: DUF2865 domain-containing protein [Candidatus Kaistia colombiensis]|nr:MAG: DUF2865 domain-containing protein [Kaistia sp.]
MVFAAGAGMAEAASSVCVRLEGRLDSLQRSQNSSAGKVANQDNAINQQRAALNAANADARRAGCKGGFLMFKSNSAAPQCTDMLKRINGIQANLNRLEQRRSASSFDPNSNARQRSDTLQQLALNDCGQQYAAYAQQRPRNFLERLFNPENRVYETQEQIARVPATAERDTNYSSAETERGFGRGSYRTLCVRTCDGYYFPISFATRRSSFATDEQVCQQMCPGTNVALYAHRNPGQNSGDARSTTDETPYSALSTAFAYRTSFNPGCTCGSPSSLAAFTGGYSASTLAETPATEAMPPVPGSAPVPGEDPETLANRAGALDPDSLGTTSVEAPVANLAQPRQASVARRVGPSYFYAAQ